MFFYISRKKITVFSFTIQKEGLEIIFWYFQWNIRKFDNNVQVM